MRSDGYYPQPCLRRLAAHGNSSVFPRSDLLWGSRGKQARSGYLLKRPSLLGTHRSETLVFEDAAYAVSSAKTAGLPVAAVYDAASAKETAYLQKTADFYLPAFRIDLLPPIG